MNHIRDSLPSQQMVEQEATVFARKLVVKAIAKDSNTDASIVANTCSDRHGGKLPKVTVIAKSLFVQHLW